MAINHVDVTAQIVGNDDFLEQAPQDLAQAITGLLPIKGAYTGKLRH